MLMRLSVVYIHYQLRNLNCPDGILFLGGVRNDGGESDGILLLVLLPKRFFGVVAGRRLVGV